MKDYVKYIREHGIFLEEQLGVKQWVLKREDALEALNLIKAANKAVLGGDVFLEKNNKFNYPRAFWSSSYIFGESKKKYIERSLEETEKYIREFPEDRNDGICYYSLGIDDNGESNKK